MKTFLFLKIQKYLFIVLTFILPFQVISCDSQQESATTQQDQQTGGPVKDVGAGEFSEGMDNENVVVLDVRTPAEYKDGHLANAILIDFYSPDFEKEISELDQSKTYYIYCHSGNRSSKAANLMKSKGFGDLYNLEGGISAWRREGFPIKK